MNKVDALNWLFENVTKWPVKDKGVVSSPDGWLWGQFCDGQIKLYKAEPTHLYAECHIEQREWLTPLMANNKPKKFYIAGPMTGLPNCNREAFFIAAELLKAKGHIVLNPAILPDGLTQPECMQICISMLQCSNAIYMLKGWEKSKGAIAEKALAFKIGLEIIEE